MPTWIQRQPLFVALAVVAVALAGVIAAEVYVGGWEGSVPAVPAKRTSAADAKLLPPVVAVAPEQAYPEVPARPLFTPTRRPAPEAVAQPTVVRGQYVLLGITVAGNTRIAILREKASGRIVRVEKGKDIGNIKVSSVEPEVIILNHGSEQEVLSLQVQKPVPLPGAAPGAPGAPATPAGGPFAASAPPAGAPGAAPAAPPAPAPAPGSAPAVAPSGIFQAPGSPVSVAPVPPGTANASAGALPQAASAPMSPEELLARRRARRAQQTQ
jgi:hypothetical protein